MSEEIVRRLRNRSRKELDFLKESMNNHSINEDDEEDIKDPEEEKDNEEDTSADNTDVEDAPEEEENTEDDFVDPDGDTEEENTENEEDDNEYVNPLDNSYAVKHTIGDEVLLAYANGTNSKLKGEIDGYDKEGFYRIKWSNGLTTNGITDLALSDLVSKKHENTCVCGSTDFIKEGKEVVCDKCGRKIRESTDPLTLADKSRPKDKKLIRSEAHPASTVLKPPISEAIRKAFKNSSSSLKESIDEDDVFYKLKELEREFWSRLPELKEDIEDLGYTVDEINQEYVVVSAVDDEDNDYGLLIPIDGTSRTMTLDLDRARRV